MNKKSIVPQSVLLNDLKINILSNHASVAAKVQSYGIGKDEIFVYLKHPLNKKETLNVPCTVGHCVVTYAVMGKLVVNTTI
jgi:hypothetical protein